MNSIRRSIAPFGRQRSLMTCLFLFLALGLGALPAVASTPIVYGDNLQSSISVVGEIDEYTFDGTAGDIITIRMQDSSSGFQPSIEVLDPSAATVASSTGTGSGWATVDSLTLALNGTYTIRASDSGGNATANYGLDLQRQFQPGQATPIAYGDNPQDVIDAFADSDAFVFAGTAGDIITIRMQDKTAFGGYEPAFKLYDPTGLELATATGTAGAWATLEDFPLAATGDYLIAAYDQNGNLAFSYGLDLQRQFQPGQSIPIAYGQCIPEVITVYVGTDAFVFEASAGDLIRVQMQDNSGVEPRIQIFDPMGESLALDIGTNAGEALVDSLAIVQTGTHTILALDHNGDESASYEICLERIDWLRTPIFTVSNADLFQDSLPNSGALDAVGDPADLVIRLDRARDLNSGGPAIVPGDSILVDVFSRIPLNSIPHLTWALEANASFDPVRVMPAGAVNVHGNIWTGSTTGDLVAANVAYLTDRYRFDLPDGDAADALFFPGDRLHYFIEAVNDSGLTTVPPDTTAFLSFDSHNQLRFDPVYTVHGLPTLTVNGGTQSQPSILLWNDNGHLGGLNVFLFAFNQLGLFEGEDFDVYTTLAPDQLVSNGLGSAGAHGATPVQLAGYSCLIYSSGALDSGLISDGSASGGNDKSDDLLLLQDWKLQDADRLVAYFGDNFASGMIGQANAAFVAGELGVTLNGSSVGSAIDEQRAPAVTPTGMPASVFVTSFAAMSADSLLTTFDEIEANGLSTVVVSHEFLRRNGQGYSTAVAAGIWHDRQVSIGPSPVRRVDATFPFAFSRILNVPTPAGSPPAIPARAHLLAEILNEAGHVLDPGAATGVPELPPRVFALDPPFPNPFNPAAVFHFYAPREGMVRIQIFDLRGRLVAVPFAEEVSEGERAISWNGTDRSGRSVSGGVYLYSVRGFGKMETGKLTLVK